MSNDVNQSPGSAYGQECCFCLQPIDDYGHNPEPLKSWPQRCCRSCNDNLVIPERVKRMQGARSLVGNEIIYDLDQVYLALHACEREGRQPIVVSHSWWLENSEQGVDYLVLQDDTWKTWVRGQ